MTKAELIDRIARSRDLPPDISKKLIGQILSVAFDELAGYFARSRVTRSSSPRFTFPHFGTFTKKRRSARRGVNPRTLEPIQIEACNTIDFKASRELREAMNPSRPATGDADHVVESMSAVVSMAVAAKGTKAKAAKGTKKASKKKSTRKAPAAKAARRDPVGRRATAAAGPDRRRLTPRDEETELGPLLGDSIFDAEPGVDLPASPMQRVKGRRRTRSRGTG